MTKKEYLDELKSKITDLSEQQINESIQYYSDYFEDAKDDEKLINELGSPDELAESIKNKYQMEVEKKRKKELLENDKIDKKALYFSYEPSKVKNLSLVFGAANVVMIPGKTISVETRGIENECLISELSSSGTLTISNNKRVNLNFWGHDRNYRAIPRILITVPSTSSFEKLKIYVGAGNFIAKDTKIECKQGDIEVGAGNLNAGIINSDSINLRCGMGNLNLSGSLKGKSNIDCGMGCVGLALFGKEEDYSYDAKVGLGDFLLNNEKKSGVGKQSSGEEKENHFSVNCGLGSVHIKLA